MNYNRVRLLFVQQARLIRVQAELLDQKNAIIEALQVL
jgi:hypothetical protein